MSVLCLLQRVAAAHSSAVTVVLCYRWHAYVGGTLVTVCVSVYQSLKVAAVFTAVLSAS
jgi:hypothetical protein